MPGRAGIPQRVATPRLDAPNPAHVVASGLTVTHGTVAAVRDVDLSLHAGEVTALMGRNGAGKSSLLWALHGSGARSSGAVSIGGVDPASESPPARRGRIGLVPQSAPDLLYLESVAAECGQSDHESGATAGTARAYLDRLAPGIADDTHPGDLSEGQRLALVVAIQLTAAPQALLLDEPTRGLDYSAKAALALVLRQLAGEGTVVLVSTHDVEFAAHVADRVVVMAGGRLVADGSATDVLCDSPAFAPQVAKVMAPHRYLTVEHLQAAVQGQGVP